MVSAIQEQRDSKEEESRSPRLATDVDDSNLGHHQIYHSRRRTFAVLWRYALLIISQWKVLVIDESSKKIIDNVVKEDDILNENIASEWERGISRGDVLNGCQILRGSRRGGR